MAGKLLSAALAGMAAAATVPHLEERQASEWSQCGGIGWSGATTCASGTTCVAQNPYYSQCLPNSQVTSPSTTARSTTSSVRSTPSSTSSAAPPPSSSQAAGSGPCDIYAAGGTPCAAAHSTTRALYSKYSGKLYQVQKASGAYADIGTVSAGGIADSAAQDSFCSGTTCVITQIYDQSPNGNHLGEATGYWKGPGANGYDKFASATGAPIYLDGKKVYGVYISPGYGYRRSDCTGTVTGNAGQGVYDVIDGTHYNQWCCFDYGNSEVSATDTGNGHMEAIYFGDSTQWDSGSGSGPWIMADIENGMYSGYNPKNNAEQPISHRFVTAMLRGAETDHFDIRGGDATTGGLTYYVNSSYPAGYYPMHLEGAIILGTGGDNSNSGQGTWYEGAMTVGYPSDAAQNAVQANIVAAKYATTSQVSGRALRVGSTVSLAAAGPATLRRSSASPPSIVEARYLAHTGARIHTERLSSSTRDAAADGPRTQSTRWTLRTGLGNAACLSLESADTPGSFLRNDRADLVLGRRDGSKQFDEDATFCPRAGLDGQEHTHSLVSWNEPNHLVRLHEGGVWAARNGGHRACDALESFSEDASWVFVPAEGL